MQVVDSMIVERARGESQSMSGSLQSLCWGSSAFGSIISSYFSGSLVSAYGVRYIIWSIFIIFINIIPTNDSLNICRFVFGLTALLPLITSAVAILVREEPVLVSSREHNLSPINSNFLESSKKSISQLLVTVKQPNVLLPTLFIFLWQATPQSDSAMFYFTYVDSVST